MLKALKNTTIHFRKTEGKEYEHETVGRQSCCEIAGSTMKLVPLGDRVVLKQLVAEETTKSGIVIPGQSKEKPQQAEVIAVGPGGIIDGNEVKMYVKVGDKVITSKYSGTEVKIDGVEYTIVKQSDILAIVE